MRESFFLFFFFFFFLFFSTLTDLSASSCPLLPTKQIPISTNKWKHVGCIAGGTGITPMYQ